VNNAGTYDTRPLHEIDAAHYAKTFDLNVRAVVLVTAEMARRMNDNGRIVCISSGGRAHGDGQRSVYAASKAAVEGLVRCWAADLGGRGTTVNAVAPGLTETEMMKNNGWPEEAKQTFLRRTSLGRLGQPADVADAVAMLCSNDARWVTGVFVDANGGYHE
jgi:3-oxoacyl-[acyl-carrier protein] reductase